MKIKKFSLVVEKASENLRTIGLCLDGAHLIVLAYVKLYIS